MEDADKTFREKEKAIKTNEYENNDPEDDRFDMPIDHDALDCKFTSPFYFYMTMLLQIGMH